MTYDQFTAEWNGKQITQYGGECVAGIAEFEAENNLPIVWGDAHTWINNPIMLAAYDWVANNPNDPNQIPPKAAIVVWPLPNEHIAFFDHNLANQQFMSFGQNSGGPTMHFQPHSWANVAGWYVPKQAAPAPPPAPAAVVYPYHIDAIPPKQVRINKDTHLWGLTYDNFTAINANPLGDAHAGDIKTVGAILYHNIGYNYYLEDADVPSGYNVLDCDEYTPPPIPPPPAPVAPPAPPAGPLSAPSSEQYETIKELTGYTTSNQAINHAPVAKTVQIPAGSYFIFNKRFDANKNLIALNITKTQGQAGGWINPADNVETPPAPAVPAAPPAPAAPDFAYTYKEFSAPELYVAMRDLNVSDLAGLHASAKMPQYSVTYIAGTFNVGGIDYARPKSAADKDWWYGIAWTDPATNTANIELETEVFDDKTTLQERQATKTLTKADNFWIAVAHVKKFVLGIVGIVSKIKPGTSKNKQG